MGFRYIAFRSKYELERKLGLLKRKYPSTLVPERSISLSEWKKTSSPFFFDNRDSIEWSFITDEKLKKEAADIFNGKVIFFSGEQFDLGLSYDWLTNPVNHFTYDIKKHWTEIQDLAIESGDIKYVWEKSRFCYLYTVIRYDRAYKTDSAAFVFNEINSWIDANPLNYGPNYLSSQEIALRVLNWTFFLYYYKHSEHLTPELFDKILLSIYGQIDHIYKNINFSLISVRNNHAITETLTVYLAGLLFPFFPESHQWRREGKKLFEEEIAYQIYSDGTYLQFSMNYHRVVVQLLTWAIILSEKNQERLSETTLERGRKSLEFLFQCQDEITGELPNYGANDGSLFFPLSGAAYRDYRPQLSALACALKCDPLYDNGPWIEESLWYCAKKLSENRVKQLQRSSLAQFDAGGYYIIRDDQTMTFVRCGSHKDRPSQADNLHVDIWINGGNVVRDAGSYRYNAEPETVRYFSGTRSHNTVMLGDHDQMLKGPRFIWTAWSQSLNAQLREYEERYEFEGSIHAFKHIDKHIFHHRIVRKQKSQNHWQIFDTLVHETDELMYQRWNVNNEYGKSLIITAFDEKDMPIEPNISQGWFSDRYGIREKSTEITFMTRGKKINTHIMITDIVAKGMK